MCWDFICVIDDEDIVWPSAYHPGHAIACQEGTQVVISNPAVLPTALWEVVEEHVQDLVTYVVIRTIEEEPQETGENTDVTQGIALTKMNADLMNIVMDCTTHGCLKSKFPYSIEENENQCWLQTVGKDPSKL